MNKKSNTLSDTHSLIYNAFNYLPAPVFIMDSSTMKFIEVNEGACSHTGYSREELLNMGPADLNPEFSLESLKYFLSTASHEENLKIETMHQAKNGNLMDVEVCLSPIEMENKKYVLAVVKEVLHTVPADSVDEKLSFYNRYKFIVENAQVGIWQVDENFNTVFVNDYFPRILGFTKEEMVGKNAMELVPAEEVESTKLIVTERSKGTAHQYEIFFNNTNGQKLWFLVQPTVLMKGGVFKGSIATLINITEAKEKDEKAKVKDRWYKALIEKSTNAICLLSAEGKMLYISPSVEIMLGYSEEDFVGKDIDWDKFYPGDEKLFKQTFEEVSKTPNNTSTVTYRYKIFKSSYVWIEATITNFLHDSGINAIVLNFRDITEKKEADNKLQESEARYKEAEKLAELGHWERNLETNNLVWSDHLYELFEIEKNNAIDLELFLSKVHPDDRQNLLDAITMMVSSKGLDIQYRILLTNGGVRYIHEVGKVFYDSYQSAVRVAGFSQDVTNRIQAEEEFKKIQEQLALIFNTTLYPMWLLKVEDGNKFRYMEVNYAYTYHSGYDKSSIVGKLSDDTNYFNTYPQFKDRYMQVIEERQSIHFSIKMHLVWGIKIADVTISPIINDKGDITQLLCSAIDITDKKTYENELIEKNQQLRELTSYLHNVREEERTHIAREIHDELGQLLTAIKMEIAWVKKHHLKEDSLIRLNDTLVLVDETINTVRKISAALRPSILDDLGLSEALTSHGNDFAQRTGIAFYFKDDSLNKNLTKEMATTLYRVFQEALTNIMRHSNASNVNCYLTEKDGVINLKITDNGVGIKKENGNKKLKTFGLLGMKERISMLNGEFNVWSEPGKGTELNIKVPINM